MTIIERGSPLLRLPRNLNRRQTLFLDGIRHAVEIADYGYVRLVEELTKLALANRRGEQPNGSYTTPFLYAWAVVDAIDRIRALLHLMPGLRRVPRSDGKPGFRYQTKAIRDLRNVTHHLAQRVDYVIAQNGTALGKLSWITILTIEPIQILSCAIIPGTLANIEAQLVNPAGRESVVGPSDLITLNAGEHTASLSEAMIELRRIVETLEEVLSSWISKSGLENERAGTDTLVVALMEFED